MTEPAITYLPHPQYENLAIKIAALMLPLADIQNPQEAEGKISAAAVEAFKMLNGLGIRTEAVRRGAIKTPDQIEFLDAFESYYDGSKSGADRLRAAATAILDDQTPVSESFISIKLAELNGEDDPHAELTYVTAAKMTLKHLNGHPAPSASKH